MNTLDVIILIVLLLGTLNGFRQGLVKALTSLVGWILAIICAIRYTDLVAPMLSITPDPVVQKIIAFVLIVVVVILCMWLVTAVVGNILRTLKLNPINRLAGAAFGALKSMLVVLVFMQTLGVWFTGAATWQQSKMVQVLLPFAPMASTFSRNAANSVWQKIHAWQGTAPNNSTDDSAANAVYNNSADDTAAADFSGTNFSGKNFAEKSFVEKNFAEKTGTDDSATPLILSRATAVDHKASPSDRHAQQTTPNPFN